MSECRILLLCCLTSPWCLCESVSVPESVVIMMTSSSGNSFRITGPLCGEFIVTGEFPSQRPVTRSFDVFFDLRLNKRLSKQSWGWWFETPSRSWWRHCNDSGCYWPTSLFLLLLFMYILSMPFLHTEFIFTIVSLDIISDTWHKDTTDYRT